MTSTKVKPKLSELFYLIKLSLTQWQFGMSIDIYQTTKAVQEFRNEHREISQSPH